MEVSFNSNVSIEGLILYFLRHSRRSEAKPKFPSLSSFALPSSVALTGLFTPARLNTKSQSEQQAAGRPWTRALDFDYSLAIGEWMDKEERTKLNIENLLLSPEEAITAASKVMTIRQGDLIYIQRAQAPTPVKKEEVIRVEIDGEDKLYCKIK